VNPSNLVYDGERLLLLDWDIATTNDPFYDLAAVSVFLRMDEATSCALLAAYDRAPVSSLPAGFAYHRRLVATFCGTIFLHLARQAGYPGDADAALETTATLFDCYQRMRAGALDVRSADGQWAFGLALLKHSFEC
jgi:aminoglycoside phosphotransferase (APT) family kinase protein